MRPNQQPKGKFGENLAASYLREKGYRIIAQNFKARYDELDLIAVYKNTLVVVEVKTRWGTSHGSALEAITPWKLTRLTRATLYYKELHPKLPETLRIDLVAIQLNGEGKLISLDHIENISPW